MWFTAIPQKLSQKFQQFLPLINQEDLFYVLKCSNPTRLTYVLDTLNKHNLSAPLKVLDVGCGVGIFAHSLAQYGLQEYGYNDTGGPPTTIGHQITAIDINANHLEIAKAINAHENITYISKPLSDMAADPALLGAFDVITLFEVIEHVEDKHTFMNHLSKLLKPGGLLFFSTLNRNLLSYTVSILLAEKLLRTLPRHTHQLASFITPIELTDMLQHQAIEVRDLQGIWFNPFTSAASINRFVQVNYIGHALKHN